MARVKLRRSDGENEKINCVEKNEKKIKKCKNMKKNVIQ